MSGPMRAPSTSLDLFIPYSGTLANGDCVIYVGPYLGANYAVEVLAYYQDGTWFTGDSHTTLSTDADHILHIQSNAIYNSGKAAFIPGPNH